MKKGHKIKIKIVIFQDAKGEFRWNAQRSGRIIADCGEGYTTKSKLKKSLEAILLSVGTMNYVVEDTNKRW